MVGHSPLKAGIPFGSERPSGSRTTWFESLNLIADSAAESSNGRTQPFEGWYLGSNPSSAALFTIIVCNNIILTY